MSKYRGQLYIWVLMVCLTTTSSCQTNHEVNIYKCSELGIMFKLPKEMKLADSTTVDKLSSRGNKAENEVFPNSQDRVWTSSCIKPLIGEKNVVLDMASISDKEIFKFHKNYKEFVKYYFQERKYFTIMRMKSIAHLAENPYELVETKTIANLTVDKLKFSIDFPKLSKEFYYLAYLIRKNDRVYRIEYVGKDKVFSEFMEKSIENGEKIN